MKIEKIEDNGKITLRLDGWLDTASSVELGNAVEEIKSANELILDFTNAEYMSSAGLRQVVSAHKVAKVLGASFSVINVGNEVMSIFKMTGIDKKINISSK